MLYVISRPVRLLATVAAIVTVLTGCGGGNAHDASPSGTRPPGQDVTIRVPSDASTISAGVALAKPGDLVLVSPGEYHETVTISTKDVTLRGTARSKVIIDGQLHRSNGIVVTAPGVAVENLTVRNNTGNGVLITGSVTSTTSTPGSGGYDTGAEKVRLLNSYLVSHVTATRNGLYGIYAFSARNGVIEDSYVSGGADSGIYVGQCKPCNTIVRGNIAELSAVGYEGTNASGNIYVIGNRFVGNRVGATVNADHKEKLLPQTGAVLAGNVIGANQQAKTPEQADGGWGIGIGIDGGTQNTFLRNRVANNARAGLIVTASEDLAPSNNKIIGNRFSRNGVDVAFTIPAGITGKGNCLKDNTLASTLPAGLATKVVCPADGKVSPTGSLPDSRAPAGIAFSDVAAPPPQPNLPHAATAGPTHVPPKPDFPELSDITVPAGSLLASHALVRLGG